MTPLLQAKLAEYRKLKAEYSDYDPKAAELLRNVEADLCRLLDDWARETRVIKVMDFGYSKIVSYYNGHHYPAIGAQYSPGMMPATPRGELDDIPLGTKVHLSLLVQPVQEDPSP